MAVSRFKKQTLGIAPPAQVKSGPVMSVQEVLGTFKKLGKPQTAAIYKRHGAGDNVFGTLTSEIVKVQKKIKVDHALATELWRTGNAEARILALQVSDPGRLARADAERLLQEGQIRFLGCYVAGLLGRGPIGREAMRSWMASTDELTREIGYGHL